jgi:mannose-1-phosphate guanylyltransferase
MKAVILAGGEGTRLRPLTLALPKPVVPVVDRPFLQHQLDLLARVGVDEVIFSVAYRPEKIQDLFGEGSPALRIRYLFEEVPLGTGGAVKNAEAWLDETTIVLNGDVLTDLDLGALLERHRASEASATLFLTPVENPRAYGLVQTDVAGHVQRFLEKPSEEQIAATGCNTINAGIYVLATRTLALMPAAEPYSIERGFFPSLLARGERVAAHVHAGYWIDIGTPEKYLQVHRDVLDQRFPLALHGEARAGGWIAARARVSPEAELHAPFFIGPGCEVAAGARLGPHATLVADVRVASGAKVEDSVVWSGGVLEAGATLRGALLGPGVHVGAHAHVGPGAVLGADSQVSTYSRTA